MVVVCGADLVSECKSCCKGGSAAATDSSKKFQRAELQVTKRNLARFPEVQQFVDKSASKYENVKIRVRHGACERAKQERRAQLEFGCELPCCCRGNGVLLASRLPRPYAFKAIFHNSRRCVVASRRPAVSRPG